MNMQKMHKKKMLFCKCSKYIFKVSLMAFG